MRALGEVDGFARCGVLLATVFWVGIGYNFLVHKLRVSAIMYETSVGYLQHPSPPDESTQRKTITHDHIMIA